MARPVWQGAISLGRVNIGVDLYRATQQRTVSFHQLEKGTDRRIRNKRVAEGTDREVDYDNIVKGYETADGGHVIVTPEELQAVAPESSRTIAIDDFVELADIDPTYYAKTYYLAPRDEASEHAYVLLREAMKEAGLAGIATLVTRGKEHLAAIRPVGDVLVLSTMLVADEVREPRDTVCTLPGDRQVSETELDAALRLIRELTNSWNPKHYHDTQVDLMSALHESIERAEQGRDTPRRSWRRDRRATKRAKLADLSKRELYERAGDLGVEGRSKTFRDEFQRAIAKAS